MQSVIGEREIELKTDVYVRDRRYLWGDIFAQALGKQDIGIFSRAQNSALGTHGATCSGDTPTQRSRQTFAARQAQRECTDKCVSCSDLAAHRHGRRPAEQASVAGYEDRSFCPAPGHDDIGHTLRHQRRGEPPAIFNRRHRVTGRHGRFLVIDAKYM